MAHSIQNKQGGKTDADFWTQYSSQTPRMCVCIYVEPSSVWLSPSRPALGFTSNSRNMTLPGYTVTFKATPSISPTTVESALNEPSTVEVIGAYMADSFDEDDVLNGKWDGAKVQVLVTCWDDTDFGQWIVHEGDLGEFESYQNYFKAESRGYMARLNNEVGPATSRLCRVKEFRDSECGHTASTVSVGGTSYNVVNSMTVATVNDRVTLTLNASAGTANNPPSTFFDSGFIAVSSTAVDLGTLKRGILDHTYNGGVSHTITLQQPFPFTVTVGDVFNLVAGCNRTIDDCLLYDNVVNFRGEPYIPGIENANRVGSNTPN